MTKRLLSYLVLSDIHIGARTTSAAEIIAHLRAFFSDFTASSQFVNIDVLFIAGDLWDDTIVFGSDAVALFIPFFDDLMKWCGRHGIKVRILEGTPRHDRRQGASVAKLAEVTKAPSLDFKYVPTLSIEKMEDLGISILYVPDECRPTSDAIARDVDAALVEAGLEKVDIAIMHGMFKYQMGNIPANHATLSKVHDEGFYLARVRQYINIGHVHTASQYNRILAQGSFDRLSHGEEAPKGAYLVKQLSETEWGHFFIENPLAKIYKTVQVKGTLEQALNQIDKSVKKLPHGSYVRIQALATHPIFRGFETLRRKYPLFVFSKKDIAEEEEKKEKTSSAPMEYVPIILNRETLTEAIFTDVSIQNTLTPEEEFKLHGLLEALHD